MRGLHNIYDIRVKMVEFAIQNGRKETARYYKTSRVTVRKWLRRFEKERLNGLKDKSKAPNHIPHKTPKEVEEKIIDLRKGHPAWGPEKLKMHYELSISTKAIARIIRQAGLTRKRKKKWKKQRDLREVNKKLLPFEFIEVDVRTYQI